MIDLTKTNETICIFGLLNEQQTQTEKEKNDHLFSLIAVADSIAAVIIITQLWPSVCAVNDDDDDDNTLL